MKYYWDFNKINCYQKHITSGLLQLHYTKKFDNKKGASWELNPGPLAYSRSRRTQSENHTTRPHALSDQCPFQKKNHPQIKKVCLISQTSSHLCNFSSVDPEILPLSSFMETQMCCHHNRTKAYCWKMRVYYCHFHKNYF